MTSLTKKQINWLDKCTKKIGFENPRDSGRFFRCTKGTWTLNPKTGLVDVDGGFNCSHQRLKGFKGVKFGKVEDSFNCNDNQLTSLVGAPREVGGSFRCDNNQLTSLEGAPQSVGDNFCCNDNQLTSLVGAPRRVRRYFSCNNNQLTTMVGAPREVGGLFHCDGNRLTSLVGAPREVGSEFSCSNNQLTSLEGAPLKVGGEFWCDANPVSEETLVAIFEKMKEGHSFVIAAASLRKEMSERSWKLISPHIPDAIRPGVSMLGRFGLFN